MIFFPRSASTAAGFRREAAASAATTKTLRPCVAESVGRDGTPGGFDSENLYIEGDQTLLRLSG